MSERAWLTGVESPNQRRIGFAITLMAAMAAATSFGPMLGLLGTEFLQEFQISRGELGLLIGLSMVVGGACSPIVGVLTDRLGGRKALALTFAFASVGYLVIAAASDYLVLMVAAFVSGFSIGLTNPATNKLIATEVAPGRRGLITGTKQSAVQIGTALLGLLVPIGVIALGLAIDRFDRRRGLASVSSRNLSGHIGGRRLCTDHPGGVGHGFLEHLADLGFRNVARNYRQPLDPSAALCRRGAGVRSDRGRSNRRPGRWLRDRREAGLAPSGRATAGLSRHLRTMALLTVLGVAGLAWSVSIPALVWPAAVVMGFSAASWNSVGMLATIVTAGPARAGAATGWVQLGFLTGSGAQHPALWMAGRHHRLLPAGDGSGRGRSPARSNSHKCWFRPARPAKPRDHRPRQGSPPLTRRRASSGQLEEDLERGRIVYQVTHGASGVLER